MHDGVQEIVVVDVAPATARHAEICAPGTTVFGGRGGGGGGTTTALAGCVGSWCGC